WQFPLGRHAAPLAAAPDAGRRGGDGLGGRAGEFRQGGRPDAAQAGGAAPERIDGGTDDGGGRGAARHAAGAGGGVRPRRAVGLQMRRQGAQVGMDAAEQWIALTDGGNGLEGFLDVNFPRAVKILDFQHAATHLATFAKQFRPDTSARLLAAWCHTLKHAGGAVLIKVLQRLDRKKMTAEVRKGHDDVLGYLGKNEGRMDYPKYLRNGWQIASGAVESACKTVVN